MKIRISTAAATCAALLTGCSMFDDRPRESPPVTANACIQANTEVPTCEANRVCPIYVFNTPSGTVVFPYKLKVPARQRVRIVWHLLEPKASFMASDGPQELKNNDEFENGGPTTDAEGGSISASGRKYQFVYKNTKPARTHHYTIQFRNQSGTVFRCDPNIENEAG